MKLKALDQIAVSSVQADALRPGQEFTVSAAAGKALLEKHPSVFELIDDAEDEPEAAVAEADAAEKAAEAPENKKAAEPENKAAKPAKKKAKG